MNIIDLLDVLKDTYEAIKEDGIAPSDINVVAYVEEGNFVILDKVLLKYDAKHESGVLAFKLPGK